MELALEGNDRVEYLCKEVDVLQKIELGVLTQAEGADVLNKWLLDRGY